MGLNWAFYFVVFSTVLASTLAKEQVQSPVLGAVYELTDLNFDFAVNGSASEWMVDVYAPWQVIEKYIEIILLEWHIYELIISEIALQVPSVP